MNDDTKNDAPKTEETRQGAVKDELTQDDLEKVIGGFNPQPDPPGKQHA